jgi:hypothetical protein
MMEKPLKKKKHPLSWTKWERNLYKYSKKEKQIEKKERKSSVSQKANEMVFSLFK